MLIANNRSKHQSQNRKSSITATNNDEQEEVAKMEPNTITPKVDDMKLSIGRGGDNKDSNDEDAVVGDSNPAFAAEYNDDNDDSNKNDNVPTNETQANDDNNETQANDDNNATRANDDNNIIPQDNKKKTREKEINDIYILKQQMTRQSKNLIESDMKMNKRE